MHAEMESSHHNDARSMPRDWKRSMHDGSLRAACVAAEEVDGEDS